MTPLELPADLQEFLTSGRQLSYEPETCEAGSVTLARPEQLKIELFPMDCQSTEVEEEDPHCGESGCYLVEGVSLCTECTGGYDAAGLLLWLPHDGRYAIWDEEHGGIAVFGADVTWSKIVEAPAQHINAQWVGAFDDSAPLSTLKPWLKHGYSREQVHHPLPDLAEWYDVEWKRMGARQEGLRLRIERDGDRCELTAELLALNEKKDLQPISTTARPLSSDEWRQAEAWLDADFWNRAGSTAAPGSGIATGSWKIEGFRGRDYHKRREFYGDGNDPGVVSRLGSRLAELAGLTPSTP